MYRGRLIDNSDWVSGILHIDDETERVYINPFSEDEPTTPLSEEWFEVQLNTVFELQTKEFKFQLSEEVETFFGPAIVEDRTNFDFENYYHVRFVKKKKQLIFIEEQLSKSKKK